MKSAEELVKQLTQEEKLSLLTGKNFWETPAIERLGIEKMEVADGPYGLRKQEGISDHMGWNKSRPAVAYVSGPGMAASWDKALIRQAGEHLGTEAKANGVDILLGPAINIVRTPLCGRNFEYYSEDPYLTGQMAASYINGVQSKGVGTCIKHFAANNQEVDREYIDAVIDERTLREIYLAAFEAPVKEAKPWSVMSALNKLNGEYCSESSTLLTDILREEWGFGGFVMSDWNGVNDRAKALKAGLDLEMPCSHGVGEERILNALSNKAISQHHIDKACERILAAVLKCMENKDLSATWSEPEHHNFVQRLAEQCIVLLKNKNALLPLKAGTKIAVLGEFALKPRFQMDGSALVNPTRYDVPLDEINKLCGRQATFAMGYKAEKGNEKELLREAKQAAQSCDAAIVFAGLPEGVEAEGKDRKNIDLPQSHLDLINQTLAVQPNTVIVLCNGSPVSMPWIDKAPAVLECFLGGQALGAAAANILFGRVNPSGKLPVSFPKALCNTPAYLNYPGYAGKVKYQEEVFIGYRYYDTKQIEPLFAFGHGLSYTSFEYSAMKLSAQSISDKEELIVTVQIKNTGALAGAETVQLYVAPPKGCVLRPSHELRGFEKLFLQPNESAVISFKLGKRAFSYYDTELADWYAPQGEYIIELASSSRDIRYKSTVQLTPQYIKRREITGWSTIGQLKQTQAGLNMIEEIKQILLKSGKEQVLKLPFFDNSEKAADRVDSLPLRMVTLLSDNILNNDIMDKLIQRCNSDSL